MKGKVAYIPRWRRAQIGNMIAKGILVRANSKKSFFHNLVARDENYLYNPVPIAEPEKVILLPAGTIIHVPGIVIGVVDNQGTLRSFVSMDQYYASIFSKDPFINLTETDLAKYARRDIPLDGSDPVVTIASMIGTTVPAWYAEPASVIDPNAPAPQTQYMDMDEFRAISGEGIVIPPGSSVVVIPVSQYDNPEVYNTIITLAEINPGVPIADIVSSVINPDANPVYNVMLPGGPLPPVSDIVKTDVINNQVIVDTKQQYPDAPLPVIEKTIEEGNFIPVITAVTALMVNKPIITPVLTSVIPDKLIIPDTIAEDEDQMYLSGAAAAAGILALLLL